MNMLRTGVFALSLAALPLVGACGRNAPDANVARGTNVAETAKVETTKARTVIGKAVEGEIAKARKELETGNVDIGGDNFDVNVNGHHYGRRRDASDDRPHAAISPTGELLVDGKAVPATPAQRALLLEYRGQVVGIAEAGMAIGAKGADLAGDAIGQAIGSIFSGDTKEMEQRVEAQADKLKQEAMVLCKQLPPMLSTQQKLASAMPEFRPYATMTQDDVDHCARDIDHKGAWSN